MASTYELVSYENDRHGFLSVLADSRFPESPSPEEFEVESKYRKAIVGASFLNVSFAVQNRGKIEAIVLCHKEKNGLSYPLMGNHSISANIIIDKKDKKNLRCVLDTIDKITVEKKFDSYKIYDNELGQELSTIGEIAYNRGGLPTCHFEGCIDLIHDKEEIHRNIRTSYKSLVNQGDREIEYVTINKNNPDLSKFESFRQFHRQVAGRTTRPLESWEAQFEMIRIGCAELILGDVTPHGLVSAVLCIDHGNTTHYGVAVHDRDLFDKPLGHASVYKSVMNAKDRGQEIFSLGIISQKGTVSDKEFNIGTFKKGFCDRLSSFIEWEIKVSQA